MKNKIIFTSLVFALLGAVVFTANAATTKTPTIKVVSPNGGEVWNAGTTKNVVFKGNLIKEPVAIAITKPNSEGLIIGRTTTSGNGQKSVFSWVIPKTIEPRNDYKISVRYDSSFDNSIIYDESDKTFTIENKNQKASSTSSSKSKSSSSSPTQAGYKLKINKSGNGFVTDGGKINCGSKACQDTYWVGATVKLRAVPNGGYVFDKFLPQKECASVYSDGFGFNDKKLIKQAFAYGPAENVVCVTTMNKNKTITAVFRKIKK